MRRKGEGREGPSALSSSRQHQILTTNERETEIEGQKNCNPAAVFQALHLSPLPCPALLFPFSTSFLLFHQNANNLSCFLFVKREWREVVSRKSCTEGVDREHGEGKERNESTRTLCLECHEDCQRQHLQLTTRGDAGSTQGKGNKMEEKMKGEADLWIWSPKSRTDNPAWQTIRNKGRERRGKREKWLQFHKKMLFLLSSSRPHGKEDNFECEVNLKDWKDTFPLLASLAVRLTNDGHTRGKNSRQGDFLQPKRSWLALTKKSESGRAARVWHWLMLERGR